MSRLVTWSINYIDRIPLLVTGRGILGDPVTESCGALDCDTLFTFQVHAVHLGPHVVATADLMNVLDSTGVIQNPLCQGGLARVYVGRDSDIPLELESCFVLFCELVNRRRGVCRCLRSVL